MIDYDNAPIRRKDRLLEVDRAMDILRGGEYGFLAIGGKEGGYGIPLNYVLKDDRIFFHCAPEGEKLSFIAKNGAVCFCVVGRTEVQPSMFTTIYESVMAFGRITVVEDDDQRMEALELIVAKYSPEFKEKGAIYAVKSMPRTKILRLDIERVSGKSKKM